MNAEEAVRATIISGLQSGRTVSEIIEFNNVSKSTVKRLKKHYDKFIAGSWSN
jgi:transposase